MTTHTDPRIKVDDTHIPAIRAMSITHKQKDVAEEFGYSTTTIHNIVKRLGRYRNL